MPRQAVPDAQERNPSFGSQTLEGQYHNIDVKKPKYIPRRTPTPFFYSGREILHTPSICPCEDLTSPVGIFFFFLCSWFFVTVEIFRKIMRTTLAQILSAKMQKNGGQISGWACRTRVQTFRVHLSKDGVNIWACVRKNE